MSIRTTNKVFVLCWSASFNFKSRGLRGFLPKTHTKRQVIQPGCMPSLLGDGDKGINIVYGEEKNICTGLTRAAKAEQKSLVPERQAQLTNEGRTPFICTL
jgi:hypothetical protein